MNGPSIRETLDGLPPEARRRILYSSDMEIVHLEPIGDGRFIGVHLSDSDKRIQITAKAGHWSIGVLK